VEPTIETQRLVLRAMRSTDVDDMLVIFSDPKVMASFGEAPFNRDQMVRWIQRNLDHQATHGYGLFTMIHAATGVVIGDCGLEMLDIEGGAVAELGYDVRSDYWNQGYATEAAGAVRDYAFQTLRLPRLISLMRTGNHASRRVAEKIGMRRSGEVTRYGRQYWQYALDANPPDVGPAR
jgi:RimJ/RimL family protein N-acetyltransferase